MKKLIFALLLLSSCMGENVQPNALPGQSYVICADGSVATNFECPHGVRIIIVETPGTGTSVKPKPIVAKWPR